MKHCTLLFALTLTFTAQAHDHAPASRIQYVANKGQWPDAVRYRADLPGAAMFLETGAVTWSVLEKGADDRMHDIAHQPKAVQEAFRLKGHAWRVRFIGASDAAEMATEDRQPYYHNYFLGNDPSQWAGNVPVFHAVTYRQLWPGIDLRWHGQDGQVKYDVLLAPRADPSRIVLHYEGLDGMTVDGEGNLRLATSIGEMIEMHPVAWYADNHQRLACAYRLSNGSVGFHFPEGRDAERAVVIDPLLIASTLSGATGSSNYGHCATYDDAGNMYTGARNFGPSYPVTLGAFQTVMGGGGTDMSFSKYNPDGSSLIWATYLGGNSAENPHSLIVTANQELCVLGSTSSTNFPVSGGCFDNALGGTYDITLTVFNAACTGLVGSTFVGGTSTDGQNAIYINYGDTYRGEIMLDPLGNISVASFSESADFPVTAGALQGTLGGMMDGVVFSMPLDLSAMLWSTYLGGSAYDNALGLRYASGGDLFVTGITESSNFPVVAGGYQTTFQGGTRDGYVTRMSGTGSALVASSYYGTTGDDGLNFLDTDQAGDVYVYGQSDGPIPVVPAGTYSMAGGDVVIARFTQDLTSVPLSTTVGFPGGGFFWSLAPVAFLVDVCDHVYISGYNASSGYPLTADALFSTGSFYLAAFDVDMTGLLFGTYFGGSHVDGGTSRFDKDGIIYQGVCSGMGSMTTVPWAWATTQTIGWDIGVFKIDFQVAGVNAAAGTSVNTGCAPLLVDFLNSSTGTNWSWDFGDGSPLVYAYDTSHVYTTAGAFTVTLIASDSLACNVADTLQFPVTVGAGSVLDAQFTAVQNIDCTLNQVIATNASTGAPLAFVWDMGDGTIYTDTNVVHDYLAPGSYDVELLVYDPTGCGQPDSIMQTIVISPPVQVGASFTVQQQPDCAQLIVTTGNTSAGPSPTYQWDMGDGTVYFTPNVVHTYLLPGLYTVQLIASDTNTCNLADTATVQVQVDPVQPVSAAFTIDQVFDCAQLIGSTVNASTGTSMVFSWDMGDGFVSNDTNVVHTYLLPGTYTVTLIVSDALGCSPNDTATAQVVIDPLDPVVADFSLMQTGNCTTLTVQGINLSTGDSVSYSWDMGDGSVLNTTDVNHVYNTPGTYIVTLTVTDLGCGQDDSFSMPVTMIVELPTPLVSDAVICPDSSVVLDATSNVSNYLWSTGATTPTITVDQGGTYVVEVFTADCYGTDTVEVIEGPEYELGFEVNACPSEPVLLTIPLDGQSYSWSTGGTGQTELVIGAGEHIFTVIDDLGCPHTDTATVIALEAEAQLYAPNAFTPDGDGLNDNFLITGIGEEAVELLIFDRWGEQLYSTTSLTEPWDGRYSGTLVKQDVYVYRLTYNAHCDQGNEKLVFGHVSVLH